ncbi:hypothetical protein IQ07DRAFT_496700 [Pyrenochaeta sp. DS3sAY3a]|nr:hypothetical protein IQ07DRAFT_496700 [Pyrenochaeta sp. DS3sAY3a]
MAPESASAAAGRARQYFQESEEDRITRSYAKFPEFEADMPKLTNRFQFNLKDNLSSYLGRNNPFYQTVNPDTDYVWLLDTTAYQNRLGRWKAEFVAAYFVQNSGKDLSEVVAWVSDKIGLADDEEAKATIAKRMQPLLDSILPAHAVDIDLQGMTVRLGPSGRDGISSDELAVPGSNYKDGEIITSKAIHADATPVKVTFAKPKGWAVISDIDDTIKKTLTSSPVGILTTTFAEEPEPIKGMPELYKHIVGKLNNPPFWYLSASPYNLYPFLREFREQYYPSGTMILRDASWMNLAGFLANLTQGTEAYKVDRLEKVQTWFPKRKFIVIGDSTQSDPEAYGEAYRRHPKWIGAIYIRKVTGVAEMDENKKNDPERFEKAFKDVPKNIWYVFTDPQELYAKIDALPEIKQNTFRQERTPQHNYVLFVKMAPGASRAAELTPLYVIIGLLACICILLCFVGFVFARLWYYKGALGPEPERFIIQPKHPKRQQHRRNWRDSKHTTNTRDPDFPGARRRNTLSPTGDSSEQHGNAIPGAGAPHIDVEDIGIDQPEQWDDTAVRRHIADEKRLSRLPAFVRDDCGDGSAFPDVPVALHPIEDVSIPLNIHKDLGVEEVDRKLWLDINMRHYLDMHAARKSLLADKRGDCIYTMPKARLACEELLANVVEFLVEEYPEHFTLEEEDGRMTIHLPDILSLPTLNHHDARRTCTFIQIPSFAESPRPLLASTLHIPRPADLFAGDISSLHVGLMVVRREVQTFRALPGSGAVVMSTKTKLERLVSLEEMERRELLSEFGGWGEMEKRVKGWELWEEVVEGFLRR